MSIPILSTASPIKLINPVNAGDTNCIIGANAAEKLLFKLASALIRLVIALLNGSETCAKSPNPSINAFLSLRIKAKTDLTPKPILIAFFKPLDTVFCNLLRVSFMPSVFRAAFKMISPSTLGIIVPHYSKSL